MRGLHHEFVELEAPCNHVRHGCPRRTGFHNGLDGVGAELDDALHHSVDREFGADPHRRRYPCCRLIQCCRRLYDLGILILRQRHPDFHAMYHSRRFRTLLGHPHGRQRLLQVLSGLRAFLDVGPQ